MECPINEAGVRLSLLHSDLTVAVVELLLFCGFPGVIAFFNGLLL
jgi:hypothetical protein